MRPGGRVLVVEDEALIALSLTDMLESMGFTVCGTADNVRSAVDLADRDAPDLVIMDIRLRGKGDGIDAARQIRQRLPAAIIFVTGSCEQAMLDRIKTIPAAALLIKPVLPGQLKSAVDAVLVDTA
jgi:DNA-binding NarL/FixJ family response regulator